MSNNRVISSKVHPVLVLVLGVLSLSLISVPPVLLPSTCIALIGLIYALILLLKRAKINVIFVVGSLLCLSSFIYLGFMTANLVNSSSKLACRYHKRMIYQLYVFDVLHQNTDSNGHFDLARNGTIIPSTLARKNIRIQNYCKHYIFSGFYVKRYYAINRNLSGKKLSDYSGNNNIIIIAETNNNIGYFTSLTRRQIEDQISEGHPPLLITGVFADQKESTVLKVRIPKDSARK